MCNLLVYRKQKTILAATSLPKTSNFSIFLQTCEMEMKILIFSACVKFYLHKYLEQFYFGKCWIYEETEFQPRCKLKIDIFIRQVSMPTADDHFSFKWSMFSNMLRENVFLYKILQNKHLKEIMISNVWSNLKEQPQNFKSLKRLECCLGSAFCLLIPKALSWMKSIFKRFFKIIANVLLYVEAVHKRCHASKGWKSIYTTSFHEFAHSSGIINRQLKETMKLKTKKLKMKKFSFKTKFSV